MGTSRSVELSDEEEDQDIVIHLTAANPQAVRECAKFDVIQGEFYKVGDYFRMSEMSHYCVEGDQGSPGSWIH